MVAFAAKIARRRADATAKVETADLKAAVGALYPHLNADAGATVLDVARVPPRQPAPIAVGVRVFVYIVCVCVCVVAFVSDRVCSRWYSRVFIQRAVLKKQRIDAAGGAVATSSASADPKAAAGATPSDQAK